MTFNSTTQINPYRLQPLRRRYAQTPNTNIAPPNPNIAPPNVQPFPLNVRIFTPIPLYPYECEEMEDICIGVNKLGVAIKCGVGTTQINPYRLQPLRRRYAPTPDLNIAPPNPNIAYQMFYSHLMYTYSHRYLNPYGCVEMEDRGIDKFSATIFRLYVAQII